MEYYFYIILIFAIILKLTLYLCWYQVRRNAAAREVRIIMPDGSTRYAVVTNARTTSEERQCLPQADSLAAPYDNQGMVERPIQPRFMGTPQGMFAPFGPNGEQWKLPKYEELDNEPDTPSSFLGEPPPYSPSTETGNSAAAQVPSQVVTNPAPPASTTVSASAIQDMAAPQVYSMAAAIPTIPAATGTTAPSYAISPTTSIHISAASALARGPSPIASQQANTIMPQVGQTGPPN